MQVWLFHSTAESVCGILPPNENKPKHIVQSLAVLLHCLMCDTFAFSAKIL